MLIENERKLYVKKLLVLCMTLLLSGCTIYKEEKINQLPKEEKNIVSNEEAYEIVKEKYKQMEDSYTEIIGTTPIIYEDNKKYYTLNNYEELTNIYTETMLQKYNEENNILLKENKYYSYLLPKTKAEYDEITYTEISITESKIKYNILLYKCTKEVEGKCKNSSLITNLFELEKINEEWKIANYKVK